MSSSRSRKRISRWRACLVPVLFAAIGILSVVNSSAQAPAPHPKWNTIGPDGGDARSFGAEPGNPEHLYLGTTNSWIYESVDGGSSWRRLAKLDAVDDLVIDNIVVDRSNVSRVYAAAWKFDRPDGGLWISDDGGRNWKSDNGLKGQSVRAFSPAPSNPNTLFAGTLEGVFKSNDAGSSWKQISPQGSRELHEVESLAVDPINPNVVYAGTWHLPWKTSDGGKSWQNIKQGVIDDSDVFSIIVDPKRPNIVYASACSGIYKSENAGAIFKKIQGIPATARRTRVLRQDPVHPDTVYAGTTEGLYKTTDAGRTFQRMTGPEVIVNDVFIDRQDPSRVLLATDRGGVVASYDAAVSFKESNRGFSARKVEALMVDAANPQRILAGVVNDKNFGGVFISSDGGVQWTQTAAGLDGRDVFVLAQSAEGIVAAGTNSGIFVLDGDNNAWKPQNTIANTIAKPTSALVRGKKVTVDKKIKAPIRELASRVFALDLSGKSWVASTAGGLFTSQDKGATWQGGPAVGAVDYLSIATHGETIVAARPAGVAMSKDGGQSWWPMGIPTVLTRIHRVAFSSDGTLWLGAREGVYLTHDEGKTWLWVHRLPLTGVDDLTYDPQENKIFVSSRDSDIIYAIDAKSLDWKWLQTGFHLSVVRVAGGRIMAASLDDGVLVAPTSARVETSGK